MKKIKKARKKPKVARSLAILLALMTWMAIGCGDSEDYQLGERNNPYDPENPFTRRVISITPLTTSGRIDHRPSWSHDGAWVAYYSRKDKSIHVADAAGQNDISLSWVEGHESEGQLALEWSPKVNRIAYIHGPFLDISVRDYPRDPNPKQLTPEGRQDGFCTSLTWSHNGEQIAYVVQEDMPEQGKQSRVIKIMDADGNNTTTLNLDRSIEPIERICDWSPDGQLMVISNLQAYMVEVRTGPNEISRVQSLPLERAGLIFHAIWSRYEPEILYVTLNFGRYELWLMDQDGNNGTAILTKDTKLKTNTLLFDIPSEVQSDLDTKVIPNNLRKGLEDNEITLSADAIVQVQEEGTEWKIMNPEKNQTYIIRLEGDRLSIYGPLALKATFIDYIEESPKNNSALLFVGSRYFFARDSTGTHQRDIFVVRMAMK